MIDLYTWATPNGRKVSIALEEMNLPYAVHTVDINRDEQFDPAFLKIAPNNRIPAIVDRENGLSLMESGAILIYLAEKTGRFLASGAERYRTIEWLMWQMGGWGPMLGQANHFIRFNPGKSAYGEERYGKEAHRLYGVLNRRLADHEYVAGKDYTIADMAIWPWANRHEWINVDLSAYPNVKRWYVKLAARPAVQRGFKVPDASAEIPMPA